MALQEKNLPGKKFSWLSEFSGALGDLGTLLPHVLGAISIAGLNPLSIFTGFGLFYIFCGWFYRIPMAVQPMKAASAAVLVQKLSAGEIAAAGIVMGLALFFLGITGLVNRLAKITPPGVTAGIQLGLGLSLAILGVKMIIPDPLLGGLILIGMLPLLNSRKFPAAIFAIFAGTALNLILHPEVRFPSLSWQISLPGLILPSPADFQKGFLAVVLPQLPLTLTNAVLVTAAVSTELYGARAARVTEKNLSLTMGIGNLIAAPLGGYTMCHGSGGITAHYRFGARTKYTPYIIGSLLLMIGLILGPRGTQLLSLIPGSALGCLLFYSGIDLALASRKIRGRDEFFLVLAVAVLTLAVNPAVAFLSGLVLNQGMKRKIIQI